MIPLSVQPRSSDIFFKSDWKENSGLFDLPGKCYLVNERKSLFTGRRRKQYDDTFIIPDCVIIITGSPGKVASGVSGEF